MNGFYKLLAAWVIVLVAQTAFIVGLVAAWPDRPDCPTEDSCTVDYYDGAWHVEEVTP